MIVTADEGQNGYPEMREEYVKQVLMTAEFRERERLQGIKAIAGFEQKKPALWFGMLERNALVKSLNVNYHTVQVYKGKLSVQTLNAPDGSKVHHVWEALERNHIMPIWSTAAPVPDTETENRLTRTATILVGSKVLYFEGGGSPCPANMIHGEVVCVAAHPNITDQYCFWVRDHNRQAVIKIGTMLGNKLMRVDDSPHQVYLSGCKFVVGGTVPEESSVSWGQKLSASMSKLFQDFVEGAEPSQQTVGSQAECLSDQNKTAYEIIGLKPGGEPPSHPTFIQLWLVRFSETQQTLSFLKDGFKVDCHRAIGNDPVTCEELAATGAVVDSGVLRMSPDEVIKLVRTSLAEVSRDSPSKVLVDHVEKLLEMELDPTPDSPKAEDLAYTSEPLVDQTDVKPEPSPDSAKEASQPPAEMGKVRSARPFAVEIVQLRHHQQMPRSLDCGVGCVLFTYMEVCGQLSNCSSLPEYSHYRNNIVRALQTNDGSFLDPAYVVQSLDSLLIPEGSEYLKEDWDSLISGKRVSDLIVAICLKLIKDIHKGWIANQKVHSGPVYIFDPLFAGKVLRAAANDFLDASTLKFVHVGLLPF